ncbi:uncharacterized protein BJ171DRAFT_421102, partial [Polychytrium aggregatum]|uniref:uncharacterized protein n=1 Tax=Polychytrium aggregatum TaxID=110093 RepID=UPI0022FEF8B9
STSGSLVLIKGEKTTWSREESLAHATKAQFVDLPESSLLSEEYNELDEGQTHRDISSPVERYLRRLSSHASKALVCRPDALLTLCVRRRCSSRKQLFRDTHGIHKLIVFATKTGKVVALDTLKGVVVWTYYLPNSQIRHVDLVRDALVKFPPVLTISVESNLSNESTLVLLDALKGSPYSPSANVPAKATFSQLPKIIIKLPVDEPESRIHPLAVVGSDLKIRLFPDSEEAHRAFETVRSAMHFYLSGGVGSSSVRGYAVSSDAHVQGAYSTVQTWEFKLPDGETLAAISERSNGENVASMGRVLGDRSVLYKYLNPNTVGIVSVKAALPDHTTAYFYLLDSVTGRLYFSRAHQAAGIVSATTPSIQLLMCENFVVYTYWNHGPGASNVADPLPESFDHETDEKTRRRKMKKAQRAHTGTLVPDVKGLEVVVMELFESIKPDERDESRNYTSYSLQVPHVLTQAYSFPYTVTSIGVTTTKMGITTREILFGLKNGQLYGVNKRLLDPRRPLAAPTANDKEEMLVPYRPQIDYNPKDVASYHIEVNGIEHIQASAAVLESTSLVVAFGLDVFFTRRHPSKMFDVLSEDFNYAALILTIVALFVSIYVSKYMVRDMASFAPSAAAYGRAQQCATGPLLHPWEEKGNDTPADN